MGATACCSRCCGFCWQCVKLACLLYVYFVILWYLQRSYVWSWMYEWETTCGYPSLPANRSGIKVLVAGYAKTGTWAMSKHLRNIYVNTYHSEEFVTHVWEHLATEYWMRPENGGQRPRVHHPLLMDRYADEEFRRTGVRPKPDVFGGGPGKEGQKDHFPNDDLKVLADLAPEKLAAYISRCRVDSIAFDGIERLYWPIFEVSPDVKVIVLDWRSFDDWQGSMLKFGQRWTLLVWSTSLLYSSIHGLPWGVLVKGLDPLIGGPIDRMLRTGGAWMQYDYDAPVQLWCSLIFQRVVYSHWWGGLMGGAAASREVYEGFYEEVRRRTPPERRMSFDFRKHTYEDLCGFLGVEPCPRSGLLSHVPNVNSWEKLPFEEAQEPVMLAPIFLFCHWVNWRIYRAIVAAPFWLLGRLWPRPKAD